MNEMRKLMEAVGPWCEEFAPAIAIGNAEAPPAKVGFFDKMRFRRLHKKYKTQYAYARTHNLPKAAQKAQDLIEYYGYIAGENDISEQNLRRIQRQYEFDAQGKLVEATNTNEQFHRYTDWRRYAERQGYTCEHSGDGKIIAHDANGDDKGIWDPKYGGSGFGWFDK